MITEEELARMDKNAVGEYGLPTADIRALITEVRRLNAAYADTMQFILDSETENRWVADRLREFFETDKQSD